MIYQSPEAPAVKKIMTISDPVNPFLLSARRTMATLACKSSTHHIST